MNITEQELADMQERNPDLRVETALTKARNIVLAKAKPNKYHAERTLYEGQWYDSKREARHAQELDLSMRAGLILWWARSPVFPLPGGVSYKADFVVVDADGIPHIEDVKGFKTPIYRRNKKQVKAIYNLDIEEW